MIADVSKTFNIKILIIMLIEFTEF